MTGRLLLTLARTFLYRPQAVCGNGIALDEAIGPAHFQYALHLLLSCVLRTAVVDACQLDIKTIRSRKAGRSALLFAYAE